MFNLFHKVYTLSCIGRCIYEGPPGQPLLDYLKSFRLEVPHFSNPADFLIDVASGEVGRKCITAMALQHEKYLRESANSNSGSSRQSSALPDKDFDEMVVKNSYPFVKHSILHCQRSFKVVVRDPMLFLFRYLLIIVIYILKFEKLQIWITHWNGLLHWCTLRQ